MLECGAMVAYMIWDHGVAGSNPAISTIIRGRSTTASAVDCRSKGWGFESPRSRHLLFFGIDVII